MTKVNLHHNDCSSYVIEFETIKHAMDFVQLINYPADGGDDNTFTYAGIIIGTEQV